MSEFYIEQIPYEIASLNDPASVFDKPCLEELQINHHISLFLP